MKACEADEEKNTKRTMPRYLGGSSSGAPQGTAWFTHHPEDSHADLSSSVETASSTSRSTIVPPLHRSSSRWHSGHHSSRDLLVTCATIVGKSSTSLKTVASPSKETHLELQQMW
jgi:hypothetical protein